METSEHQEWRSRQRLDIPSVFKAGIFAGFLFYFMTGGTPWSTAGTMNAIMGRDLPASWTAIFVGHFALSILYTFVIGMAIYRFKPVVGVPIGVIVGLLIYAVNLFIFRGAGLLQQSTEVRPFMVHLMFGLFASLLYKAMSVPKPLPE